MLLKFLKQYITTNPTKLVKEFNENNINTIKLEIYPVQMNTNGNSSKLNETHPSITSVKQNFV